MIIGKLTATAALLAILAGVLYAVLTDDPELFVRIVAGGLVSGLVIGLLHLIWM